MKLKELICIDDIIVVGNENINLFEYLSYGFDEYINFLKIYNKFFKLYSKIINSFMDFIKNGYCC